jgi:hypothetical protein
VGNSASLSIYVTQPVIVQPRTIVVPQYSYAPPIVTYATTFSFAPTY